MPETLRTETTEGVRVVVLTRAAEYNTITPRMADELGAAIDDADADPEVRTILLRAEGPAFCAGYGLDWATAAQADEAQAGRPWDPVADYRLLARFVGTWQKLWYCSKPTLAAVQGWCICGGTDLVLWADIIIAADTAVFGYPTARRWGVPTTPMWVYRIGFERTKRYLFTGDEIPAAEAARIGLVLETVPEAHLADHALALARRIARLPLNQLQMMKLYANQTAESLGLQPLRTLAMFLDGIARHTPEGQEFVALAAARGVREAVHERDAPFGDYGSGPRSRRRR